MKLTFGNIITILFLFVSVLLFGIVIDNNTNEAKYISYIK